MTSATCQVRGRDINAALGFLEACLPSDSLDKVHHWLVAQLAGTDTAGGLTLSFLDRTYPYTIDRTRDQYALQTTPA